MSVLPSPPVAVLPSPPVAVLPSPVAAASWRSVTLAAAPETAAVHTGGAAVANESVPSVEEMRSHLSVAARAMEERGVPPHEASVLLSQAAVGVEHARSVQTEAVNAAKDAMAAMDALTTTSPQETPTLTLTLTVTLSLRLTLALSITLTLTKT